ncbi:MAG: hypothetical protein NTX99_10900 [Candidatus Aminicenantes bacterium]|nr:hypothetical protein [Candidatus Aminicenantes bacterium]
MALRLSGRIVVPALLIALLAPSLAAQDADKPTATPVKASRWESNLSGGWVSNGRVGLVKSFWWYALPKVFALGLSFDYVYEAMPLSVDIALNAPIPVVVPFVCAGAGTSLTSGGITFYGGGIKVRLKKRFGLIAEYRKYRYTHSNTDTNPAVEETVNTDYLGAGIAWIY